VIYHDSQFVPFIGPHLLEIFLAIAGFLQRSLAYDNSAVLFLKFTKPDDEHRLQASHPSQAWL
jgi:hypothetical protein